MTQQFAYLLMILVLTFVIGNCALAMWEDFKDGKKASMPSLNSYEVTGLGGVSLLRRVSRDYTADQVIAAALLVNQSGE